MLYMSSPSTPAASLARFSDSLASRAAAASATRWASAAGTTTTPSSSATTTSPGLTRAPAQTTGTFNHNNGTWIFDSTSGGSAGFNTSISAAGVITFNALYLGGQVFLPPTIRPEDANPRPLARNRVTNGLIGCFSADNRWLLATASDRSFELFEGVYVCLHSDPLIDGLKPGETKRLRQKLYLLPNDPAALVRRYRADFPESKERW